MAKKALLTLATLLALFDLPAQEMKLAGIEYANYPRVKLIDAVDDYEISFHEFLVFANYPKVLKTKKTILLNGFSYGFVQSTLHNSTLNIENTQYFHRIGYTFSALQKMQKGWLLIGRLFPSLASDFNEALSTEDFLMQGALIAYKKLNENARASAGFIYTTRLGQPLLLPCMGYFYKKERQDFRALLPAFINYAYTLGPKEKTTVGFRIGINGANFNASLDKYAQTQVDVGRLNYLRINIGPRFTYNLTEMLQLEAFGGLSTMRRYKFDDTMGHTYDYNSRSGAFFNVGIGIVPPIK